MLGAILGDIVGSTYEFNNCKKKDFQLFEDKARFTDDTVMTIAVCDALLEREYNNLKDEEFKERLIDCMHYWGNKYLNAGYGMHFFDWLYERSRKPYNSFGNGSGMRVSPVAYFAYGLFEVEEVAKITAEVTHNHPEGIKGAQCIAGCTYLALKGKTKEEIKQYAERYYPNGLNFTLDSIRKDNDFNETCQVTVPQAVVAFLESTDFEDAIRNAISIGGDSDTIAAMTGSIAEAFYGENSVDPYIADIFGRTDPAMQRIIEEFEAFKEVRKNSRR